MREKTNLLLKKALEFHASGNLGDAAKIYKDLLRKKENWNLLNFGVILFASLIPFGTFYIDRKYL